MTLGDQFTHEGERYQLVLIGPVTCLCAVLPSCELLRFTTSELNEIFRGNHD